MGTPGLKLSPTNTMVNKLIQFAVLFFITAVLGSVFVCSAVADKTQNDEIEATLKSIPAGVTNRFIIMVATEEDGSVNPENVAAVIEALRASGSEKVKRLENSPIIFVSCTTAAIYNALVTGYLSSVAADRLSKPQ